MVVDARRPLGRRLRRLVVTTRSSYTYPNPEGPPTPPQRQGIRAVPRRGMDPTRRGDDGVCPIGEHDMFEVVEIGAAVGDQVPVRCPCEASAAVGTGSLLRRTAVRLGAGDGRRIRPIGKYQVLAVEPAVLGLLGASVRLDHPLQKVTVHEADRQRILTDEDRGLEWLIDRERRRASAGGGRCRHDEHHCHGCTQRGEPCGHCRPLGSVHGHLLSGWLPRDTT